METVGTAVAAAEYPTHPYFGVDEGTPRFRRNDVLEAHRLKGYFGKGAELKKQYERAMRRGKV